MMVNDRACSSVVERCPDKTEVEGSIPSTRTDPERAISSVVERYNDTVEAAGSIPASRTITESPEA